VARIEYLPLRGTEGTAAADVLDSDRSDRSTGWITLYGDRPVVTVERVPAERVRLATSWVTEQQTVTDRLRREEVALESDVPLA
jgi:stress response protein YsnF